MIDVTLIIPVHNSEKFLPQIFNCIKSQNYTDFFVIFIDDGSNDGSLDLIKVFCQSNSSKYFYFCQENFGSASARKLGVIKSQTEFIIFADSDDFFDSDYIECLRKKISHNDMLVTPIKLINNKKTSTLCSVGEKILTSIECLTILFSGKGIGNYFPGKCFRADILKSIDLDYEGSFEDIVIMPKIILKCNRIKTINDAHYTYIKRDNSSSSATKEHFMMNIDALFMRVNYLKSKNIFDKNLFMFSYEQILLRYIEMSSLFYVSKKNRLFKSVKRIYNAKTKDYFNSYIKRNFLFYKISPKIYFIYKKHRRDN